MSIVLLSSGFVILIFGIAGVALIYQYTKDKKTTEESQNWSSALGKITKSYMKREASMQTGRTLYYPTVEYEYEFLGTKYTGQQIDFGGSWGSSSRKASEARLAQYPLNKNVTVYYNPANPEEAVLNKKTGMGGKISLWVGIFFLFIFLAMACVSGLFLVIDLLLK